MKYLKESLCSNRINWGERTASNQIYLVTFTCLTVDTSFIFTKKSNVAKCFFDISNADAAEIAQCCQNLDINFVSSILKLKLSKNVFYKKCGPKLISFNAKKLGRFRLFWHRKLTLNVQISWFLTTLCHLCITDIKKKIATFDFF